MTGERVQNPRQMPRVNYLSNKECQNKNDSKKPSLTKTFLNFIPIEPKQLPSKNFSLQKNSPLFNPILFFHKRYIAFQIINLIFFQPDVEKKFANKAVDAGFIGIPISDVDPFFQFKENREHPLHVVIIKVTAHDKHVEHMSPGPIHDFFKGRQVFRTLLLDDLFRHIQPFPMVGMVIMGTVRFNVVFPLIRNDDRMLRQKLLPFFFRQNLVFLGFNVMDLFTRKIAAVMDKSQIIGIQVLPGPVKARQFTKMRVFTADVIACVVRRIANRGFAFSPDMNRQINRIRRHPVLFVSCNDDFDRQNGQSFLFGL